MNDKNYKVQQDVLIIEDDPYVTEILIDYCEGLGCFRNIVTVSDGISATAKLLNQKFSVILLDIHLPKKNGIQVLQELGPNSLNDHESFCIMSGDEDVCKTVTEFNIKHFLPKPFNEAQFQEKVLNILVMNSARQL